MDIFLAPIRFSNAQLLRNLLAELSKRFADPFKTLELQIELQKYFSKERGQYFSTQIIAEAMKLTDNLNGKIILLSEVDIFVPVLTFVFGEAQLGGKHSIVSVCRLHEEFYTGESNDKLLLERTVKEVLHELGHNFGLRHCLNWDCVMHSSPGIEEVDIKGSDYCSDCGGKVEGYKYLHS
jgi:archaemetzincin